MKARTLEETEVTPKQIATFLKRPDSFAMWDRDDRMFKTWALGPVIRTRDSGLLEASNCFALLRLLGLRADLRDDWKVTDASHWACGWVHHLSFRAVNPDGSPSEVARIVTGFFAALEAYPVFDESDYSEREHDALMASLEDAARGLTDADWDVRAVLEWFERNHPGDLENRDDQGAYVQRENMRECLVALGYIPEEVES